MSNQGDQIRMTVRRGMVLSIVLAATGVGALAQQASAAKMPNAPRFTTDLAVTYTLECSKTTQDSGNYFWLNGGSMDAAVTFKHGFGIAANVAGGYASNVHPGVNFAKVSYMAGPRYTVNTSHLTRRLGSRIFGEALLGGAHAFDSVFPSTAATTSSANAFSLQAGGGVDIALAKGFSVRALEADYVLTNLPNNASNLQNDLRLAFGVSYRMMKK